MLWDKWHSKSCSKASCNYSTAKIPRVCFSNCYQNTANPRAPLFQQQVLSQHGKIPALGGFVIIVTLSIPVWEFNVKVALKGLVHTGILQTLAMEVAATILTIIVTILFIIFLGVTLLWKPSPRMKTLRGKHVLITGGSSGIGLAIAKEALSQGAFVTLISRSSAKMEKAVDKLVNNKAISADRISTKIADVGDYETLSAAIEQSFQWRSIDVVVCNAGWARVGYIDELPIKDLHATINTNLSGTVNTLHVALRLMKHRTDQGNTRPPMSVVLVSSLAGLYVQYGASVYTATKYGVKGLAEALRLELMPYNIGVSVVYPGYVETPILDECGLEAHAEILKMSKVFGMYDRNQAETPEKVAKYTLEAAKNGTFLVTSQIAGLMLSTLSRGYIPADSVGRAFIELVLYVPFRIVSCLSAIYFEVVRRALK